MAELLSIRKETMRRRKKKKSESEREKFTVWSTASRAAMVEQEELEGQERLHCHGLKESADLEGGGRGEEGGWDDEVEKEREEGEIGRR